MLKIKSINTFYGRIQALKGISLHVKEGEIATLIGANGAGKTTILNNISGLIPVTKGEIHLFDQDITNLPPEKIVALGISQVPEGRQIFNIMTVIDNLELGAYQRYRKSKKKEIKDSMEFIFNIFPILKERGKQLAGTLSGGEQQMLAISRALMSKPKLLLLDEPSMGLAPLVVKEIFKTLKYLNQNGTTILLVEQNAHAALDIAHRGYVIEVGKIILQESSEELLENKEVKRAYLGKGYKEIWE